MYTFRVCIQAKTLNVKDNVVCRIKETTRVFFLSPQKYTMYLLIRKILERKKRECILLKTTEPRVNVSISPLLTKLFPRHLITAILCYFCFQEITLFRMTVLGKSSNMYESQCHNT